MDTAPKSYCVNHNVSAPRYFDRYGTGRFALLFFLLQNTLLSPTLSTVEQLGGAV